MSARRVALVVEDRRFVDFLVPAAEAIAALDRLRIDWAPPEPVHGCRPRRLRDIVTSLPADTDLTIIAADADGAGHRTRGHGFRRKRNALLELLPSTDRVSVAVAQPSVEAWLFCHPNSFAEGLGEVGVPFSKPARWPVPRTEAQAKELLGRLIHDGTGSYLARAAFEYAREIVSRMPLEETDNASLTDWARSFRRAMQSAR